MYIFCIVVAFIIVVIGIINGISIEIESIFHQIYVNSYITNFLLVAIFFLSGLAIVLKKEE